MFKLNPTTLETPINAAMHIANCSVDLKSRLMCIMEYVKLVDPSREIDPNVAFYNNVNIINCIVKAKNRSNGIISITAHYDLYPGSTGLNDNATGIVAALLVLEQIKDKPQFDNVEICFTDHEETGGQGAKHYIKSMEEKNIKIIANINLDVVGLPGSLFFEDTNMMRYEFPSISNHLVDGGFALNLPNIPFNDSHIFRTYRIPSILLISGSSKQDVITEIFLNEHCGVHDGDETQLSNTMIFAASNAAIEICKELKRIGA